MKKFIASVICAIFTIFLSVELSASDVLKKSEILDILEKKVVEIHLRIKEYEVDGKIPDGEIDHSYFYLYGKYKGLDEAIFTIENL